MSIADRGLRVHWGSLGGRREGGGRRGSGREPRVGPDRVERTRADPGTKAIEVDQVRHVGWGDEGGELLSHGAELPDVAAGAVTGLPGL